MILRGVQFRLTGLPAWRSGQPGQVGNQAALTVESVPGSRLVNSSQSIFRIKVMALCGCVFDKIYVGACISNYRI